MWNGGSGDWDSNAARIIKDQLLLPYQYQGDWSHRGFHKYREGVAVLSKYPVVFQDAGYVSPVQDFNDIHSRKVGPGSSEHPLYRAGQRVFCPSQLVECGLPGTVAELDGLGGAAPQRRVAATFLRRDFNNATGSEGYRLPPSAMTINSCGPERATRRPPTDASITSS